VFSPFALQYGLRAKPKNSAVFADVPSEAQENIQEGKKGILYALACSNAIGTSLAGKELPEGRTSNGLADDVVPIYVISTHI
jgi:hypothetical protein